MNAAWKFMVESTQSQRAEKPEAECGICLQDVPIVIRCSHNCSIAVCRECFCRFFQGPLWGQKCLASGCVGIYSKKTVESVLPMTKQREIGERDHEAVIKMEVTQGRVFTCVCSKEVLPTSGRETRCPKCHQTKCKLCNSNDHPGQPCPAMLQAMAYSDSMKPCPMCGVLIEKSDGCMHMACKMCKHNFCWQCGKFF